MRSKKMRKILPITMAAIMVASCMPAMAAGPEAPASDWTNNWITWNAAGDRIEDIDMDAYAYYVAAGQLLKNAPAFTNQGTSEEGRNENNLFGKITEPYGYLCKEVWDLEAEGGILHQTYGSWNTYWSVNGAELTKQSKLVDSIAFLEDTAGAEDTATDWYVRHGSLDRDTSFANQTLLYLALEKAKAAGEIDNLNFEFAYGQGHAGNYDNREAFAFMNNSVGTITPGAALSLTGTPDVINYKFDGAVASVDRYTYSYLGDDAQITAEQKENAKVNIYVPNGAGVNSPVLYLVNNSGWLANSYDTTLILECDGGTTTDRNGNTTENGVYTTSDKGKNNLAAMALNAGYVVIDAGLRSRLESGTNSPVTVADAKAVISYVRSLGFAGKFIISGTSGGGALSAVVGASGNSAEYADELTKIDAVAGDNSVDIVVAYCPITDLGHADGSYEFTYAAPRKMLLDAGYSATETSGYALSDSTMAISPKLAYNWAQYVNAYNLTVPGTGEEVTAYFDTATLKASGTLQDTAKKLLIESLNRGLVKAGSKEAFLAELAGRTVDGGYKVASAAQQPTTPPTTDNGTTTPTAPKTGDASTLPLLAVVIAVGAVALAGTRKRVIR